MNSRRLVVVLGMHRSGTSAIARSLEVLGVTLGDNLYPADVDNPKGFWEDKSVLAINEELLAQSGYTYDSPGLIAWTPPDDTATKAIRERAVALMDNQCAQHAIWGFKDPRTARLLAFWQQVFEQARCDVAYVIATRNPISVFESLRKHNFTPAKAFHLWLEHLIPALSKTRGSRRVVVDYDRLLDDPGRQLVRVSEALGLQAPQPAALADYANNFLETGLRHSVFTQRDVTDFPAVPALVVSTHALLARLAADEPGLHSAALEQAVEDLADKLILLSPTVALTARREQCATINAQRLEIQRLEEFVAQKQRVIGQLNADVAEQQRIVEQWREQQPVVEQLTADLAALHAQLEQVRTELHSTARESRALKQTRWFRLREVLLFHPFGIRKLLRLADIVAGGLVPRRLRPALLPHIDRLADLVSPLPAADIDHAAPYRVQLPSPPPQDAPAVVHVIANFMTGGSSRLVVDLIEALGSQFRQYVFTRFNPNPPAYTGVDIAECHSADALGPFVAYLKAISPAFVHVHYWGDCDESWYARAIEAAAVLGLPVIENVNTPIEPFRSAAVVKYVYVSDYVRSVFGDDDARHVTVYPGANFTLFTREAADHAPDDCVGMVYRLERDKLDEAAIAPFIRIAQLRPSTRILIVGGGSLLGAFQSAVDAAGVTANFEFTRYVSYDELPGLYRRMSLFIAPVARESFGQVVPFAMSMKIPVVGYDVGAIGEILGDRDLLAPAGDAESLARIAIGLLDAPERRRDIGAMLQQRAEQRFSVQAMNAMYLQLYTQTCKPDTERA